jgi:hypothetical protein
MEKVRLTNRNGVDWDAKEERDKEKERDIKE